MILDIALRGSLAEPAVDDVAAWVGWQPALRDRHRQVEAGLGRRIAEGLVVQADLDEQVRPAPEQDGRQRDERDERDVRRARIPRIGRRLNARPCSRRRARSGSARVGRVGLDLGAQPADRHVHQPRVAEVVVAPDPVEQHVAAEDLAGVPGELDEQVELGPGQRRSCCPSRATVRPARSISTGPRWRRAASSGPRPARRSAARTRATSSGTSNGFLT